MVVVQFIAANWQALLSCLALLLGVSVSIAHMAHKDDVASSIKAIEDTLDKLSKGSTGSGS